MAGLNTTDRATIVVVFLMAISQASYARLLDDFLTNNIPATEPGLNRALPGRNLQAPFGYKSPNVNYPSGLEESTKNTEAVFPVPEKVDSKYRPLVLNLLPKGDLPPPSGPSNRGNNLIN